MTSRGQVPFKSILKMLKDCAPGFSVEDKKHRKWVHYQGQTFRNVPLGEHGKRANPKVEIGQLKGLIRHLGIDTDCAKAHLSQLR
jgi:hypothetical protein